MSLIERTDTMQARLAEAEARIERLEQENARLWETGRVLADFLRAKALDRIERLEQENARLREAGALLAKGVPPFERRMHPAFDAACCVFEEGA